MYVEVPSNHFKFMNHFTAFQLKIRKLLREHTNRIFMLVLAELIKMDYENLIGFIFQRLMGTNRPVFGNENVKSRF